MKRNATGTSKKNREMKDDRRKKKGRNSYRKKEKDNMQRTAKTKNI